MVESSRTSEFDTGCLTRLAADSGACKHLVPPRLKPGVRPQIHVRRTLCLQVAGVESASDEQEVEDVLARPMEDRAGRDGSRVALGQTEAGRYLRVIYVADPVPGSVFVITAYELGAKALRRRQKSSTRKKP